MHRAARRGRRDGRQDPRFLGYVRFFFFSSRRRHTRYIGDWSSDVCSSDLLDKPFVDYGGLSRSLGVPGERVEKAAEVGLAIGGGLASGGPYLIDVRIDPAFK